MKTRISVVRSLSVQIAATALGLSSVGLACHIDDAMKNKGTPLPASFAPDAKTVAKAPAPGDASHDSPQSKGVQYDVQFLPGGIDRVILTKRDDARNLCVQVTLDSPPLDTGKSAPALKLPENWGFERAIAVRDATACIGALKRWPPNVIDATEVAGSVRWGSSPTEGTAVDLRLSFPASGAEPAFTEKLSFSR
jgi:hypothetical protein